MEEKWKELQEWESEARKVRLITIVGGISLTPLLIFIYKSSNLLILALLIVYSLVLFIKTKKDWNWNFPTILGVLLVVIYLLIIYFGKFKVSYIILLVLIYPPIWSLVTIHFWDEYNLIEKIRDKVRYEWSELHHGHPESNEGRAEQGCTATLIKVDGTSLTRVFSTRQEFDIWYDKTTDWQDIKEIKLIEKRVEEKENTSESGLDVSSLEKPRALSILEPRKEEEPVIDELGKLIQDIKEFKPKWEVRTDRYHHGRFRNLIGEEKGTSRNLSDFLKNRFWASRVEVTIPSYGIADILVEDKYLIEAKPHIAEPGPRRDLGAKARRLLGTKYKFIIVIYAGYTPRHYQELRKDLGDVRTNIIPLGEWIDIRVW